MISQRRQFVKMISASVFTLSNITFSPSVKHGNRPKKVGITMLDPFMEEVPIIKKQVH